ncbi:MAG: RNA-binding protein [Bacteroidales bacterium]|jgi:RNA recognition motif-containing protein|nr:RNA-binding protein [Bacteroidales bacterium]
MNIFVAKLSSRTTAENLQELFSRFGEVTSAKVITDRDTGFSKRYGFVEMADDEAAMEAIGALNETEFDGSQIVVKKSEPKPERRDSRGGDRRGHGDRRGEGRRHDSDRY